MTDIFISYSHQDEQWKDVLQKHLRVLEHHAEFKIWDDRQITPGDAWLKEIEQAIASAKVVLLLVSPDFLSSDFIQRKEIPEFLKRQQVGGLKILPVILRPCVWRAAGWLESIQGLTKDNQPLSRYPWDSFELETELSQVVEQVFDLLTEARVEEQLRLAAEKQAELDEQQRKAEAQALAEQREQEAREAEARREELREQEAREAEARREELREQEAREAEARREELRLQREADEKAKREQAEKDRLAEIRQKEQREQEAKEAEARQEELRLQRKADEKAKREQAEKDRLAEQQRAEESAKRQRETELAEQAQQAQLAQEREQAEQRKQAERLERQRQKARRQELSADLKARFSGKPVVLGVFALMAVAGGVFFAGQFNETDGSEPSESQQATFQGNSAETVASSVESTPALELGRLPFEPKMVRIPGGTFTMGCVIGRDDDVEGICYGSEEPAHKVTLETFWIAETEVTVGQFRAFAEAENYRTTAEEKGSCSSLGDKGAWNGSVEGNSWKRLGFTQTDKHPVACVSWEDAQAYLKWLSAKTKKTYQLPSESQWEYAARGGNNTQVYPWGETIGKDNANCRENACGEKFDYTSPVKSFSANQYGLYDMHGNVFELLQDKWHTDYKMEPVASDAWGGSGNAHVIRGGSWYHTPMFLRSAYRNWRRPGSRSAYIGFRPIQAK